jgi:hypothetical protein
VSREFVDLCGWEDGSHQVQILERKPGGGGGACSCPRGERDVVELAQMVSAVGREDHAAARRAHAPQLIHSSDGIGHVVESVVAHRSRKDAILERQMPQVGADRSHPCA